MKTNFYIKSGNGKILHFPTAKVYKLSDYVSTSKHKMNSPRKGIIVIFHLGPYCEKYGLSVSDNYRDDISNGYSMPDEKPTDHRIFYPE